MTRPVPLFLAPELLTFLQPHPLTDECGIHGAYLQQHLSGEVFIIGRDPDRVSRLRSFASGVEDVTSVETCLNDTGISGQIKAHDLGLADGRSFDTIVYTKEATSWFGRSRDFQRLTPYLAQNGTLLAKCKWVPDSNRVRLDDIAVAGAFGFELPEVYLRFTKTATQPTLQSATTSDTSVVADGGTATVQSDASRHVPRALADQTREFRSQFPEDARKTEFTHGWSWHTRLTEYVEDLLGDCTGPVANLCCGTSELGDVRVDKVATWVDSDGEERETAATHIADATDLPFGDGEFAAVVTDPPWKVPPEVRVQLFSEAVRVVEAGGVVIHNAWWIPHHPYATLTDARPVMANVQDDSLNGPGGLSFLTTYEVAEQPDFGEATYTLADHMETCGIDALDTYRTWRYADPQSAPALDPRFVTAGNAYTCVKCECSQLVSRDLGQALLYECVRCGWRNAPGELVSTA